MTFIFEEEEKEKKDSYLCMHVILPNYYQLLFVFSFFVKIIILLMIKLSSFMRQFEWPSRSPRRIRERFELRPWLDRC